ncbi:DsrE family protein [Aquifex pyrophilus]|uniref:Uncharacterized protein n=1 Tax=Aquifex pyrophilus TaxID=2714 RepID=Q8GLL1_AQUPY|nr:hypothetical protein [Aquifex pyrophilus]
MKRIFIFLFLFLSLSFSGERVLKSVFDCAIGDLDWINLRLSLIQNTAEMLIKEGKSYKFVITIHSYCIPIVDGDLNRYPKETREKIKLIQSKLKTLKELYEVDIKACNIAMKRMKIKNVPKFIEVVPNSWITLIELQNEGYAFVPF